MEKLTATTAFIGYWIVEYECTPGTPGIAGSSTPPQEAVVTLKDVRIKEGSTFMNKGEPVTSNIVSMLTPTITEQVKERCYEHYQDTMGVRDEDLDRQYAAMEREERMDWCPDWYEGEAQRL